MLGTSKEEMHRVASQVERKQHGHCGVKGISHKTKCRLIKMI